MSFVCSCKSFDFIWLDYKDRCFLTTPHQTTVKVCTVPDNVNKPLNLKCFATSSGYHTSSTVVRGQRTCDWSIHTSLDALRHMTTASKKCRPEVYIVTTASRYQSRSSSHTCPVVCRDGVLHWRYRRKQ